MSAEPAPFHAAAAADLQLPLQQAFASARARGDHRFVVRLAPGTYRAGAVSLGSADDDAPLDVTFEGEGPAPSVLEGMTLALAGRAVILRGVVLRFARSPGPLLDVTVAASFLGERIAIVDGRRHERGSSEPALQIRAGFGGKGQRATLRAAWIVGNHVDGKGAVLATPSQGRAAFDELLIEDSVLAGNQAEAGIDPWFTRRVRLERCFVYESALATAWLHLRSPVAEVAVDRSTLALAGAALVHFATDGDVRRADFHAPQIARSALHLAVHHGAPLASLTDSPAGAPAAAPKDWSAFTAAAERLDPVEPVKLQAAIALAR